MADQEPAPVAPQLAVFTAQYTVLAAGNVIPELPLASPNRVPLAGAAAPAIVMSRKSASVADTAAQVRVLVVPSVSEARKVRYADAVPALIVRVPLMVWSALKVTGVMPTVVRPVKDRLLNVFAPVIVIPVAAALVKLTL